MVQFDGDLGKLAYFLVRTWHHMVCYGGMQPGFTQSNLEGRAARWLVSLHHAGMHELDDLDAFMQIL